MQKYSSFFIYFPSKCDIKFQLLTTCSEQWLSAEAAAIKEEQNYFETVFENVQKQ